MSEPDAAQEHLAAWKERIERLSADTKAMSDQLDQLRVTVSDEDAICEVTLDQYGSLVSLRLGDHMRELSPQTVAAAVMTAIQEAKSQVAVRSQEIIETTFGPESAAGRALAERVRQRLEPEDEEP